MERKATVVHTDFPQDRRVLAISDVHGNLPFLRGVLDKAGYGEDDILVLVGDLVVTSGLGGYYPSGLVIGSVEEVQKDDSGASSYAVLVPEADLDSLTEVAVIKSFDIVS